MRVNKLDIGYSIRNDHNKDNMEFCSSYTNLINSLVTKHGLTKEVAEEGVLDMEENDNNYAEFGDINGIFLFSGRD